MIFSKNILSTVFVVILTLGISFYLFPRAPGVSAASSDQVYERVMKTGVIRCGYINWWPAVVRDPETKQMKGYVVDYINEMGKVLDLKVEWTE
jgi:hypothetical protein